MSINISIQTGLVKTTATYQTKSTPAEAQSRLVSAAQSCNFKIIKNVSNQILFTTPVSWRSWGFNMTASIFKQAGGSFVTITCKNKVPFSLDLLGVGKKEIEKLQQFL